MNNFFFLPSLSLSLSLHELQMVPMSRPLLIVFYILILLKNSLIGYPKHIHTSSKTYKHISHPSIHLSITHRHPTSSHTYLRNIHQHMAASTNHLITWQLACISPYAHHLKYTFIPNINYFIMFKHACLCIYTHAYYHCWTTTKPIHKCMSMFIFTFKHSNPNHLI